MRRLLVAIILTALLNSVSGRDYHGTIIRVIDGDTYVFQTEEGSFKVRMLGIDSPENDQPYSRQSKEFLTRYLNRAAITRVTGTDRYGRMVGTLIVDGADINLLEVRQGYAWHYKKYLKDAAYARAEQDARQKKVGIWSQPEAVEPWNWRKAK